MDKYEDIAEPLRAMGRINKITTNVKYSSVSGLGRDNETAIYCLIILTNSPVDSIPPIKRYVIDALRDMQKDSQ